jgi:hypothetical protein
LAEETVYKRSKGEANMKNLYQCMPAGERAWLARVAAIGAVLLIGTIVAVALAPASSDVVTAQGSDDQQSRLLP